MKKKINRLISLLSKLPRKISSFFMDRFRTLFLALAEWIVFAALVAMVVVGINHLLPLKSSYRSSAWPTTNSVNGFYKMAPHSVDVLFLGTSAVVNSFCPQQIYNDYGIRSYNLASEQQSIFLSYYWLKEALRFQRPQAVVLDLKFIATRPGYEPLNTTEGLTRICIDQMKWSPVKVEAVMDIARTTNEWAAENGKQGQSAMSYFLPFMRYHSRWKYGLWETDFNPSLTSDAPLKGWNALIYFPTGATARFQPYVRGESEERAEVDPLQKEYLYKIADLCRENKIELILTNLPSNALNYDGVMTDEFDNVCSDMALELDVDYYNLSEESLYQELGIRSVRESVFNHSNYWGSVRLSKYMGKLLSKVYRIRGVKDSQYEATRSIYDQVGKNAGLQYIEDLNEYLAAINDPTYTVFITVRDEGGWYLDDRALELLKALGISLDLKDKSGASWYAVIDPVTGIHEAVSEDQRIGEVGMFGTERISYTISSAGIASGRPSCSLKFGETSIANSTRGINIVVWDNYCCTVIDCVTFDMNDLARPQRIWFTTPVVSDLETRW